VAAIARVPLLAANHPGTQSGWHSFNHADGYNQWLLDDAPGQVRSRLASSYAVSQLGLGHLVQQSADSAWRGSWRGSGFELRSDAWLAVRAAEDLLVSTDRLWQDTAGAIGCEVEVLKAISKVETKGAAFVRINGNHQSGIMPSILYERHVFHRHTCANVRIPLNLAAYSTSIRPGIPSEAGHPERSDAWGG
jgi:hypothetical protein